MTGVIVELIVAFGVLCAFWGFIIFMSALTLEARLEAIVGALMVLIPLIAGCIYVGVAS